HCVFPLGDLTKSETREIARESALKTAAKEESMEICFVPDNDYAAFLQKAGLVQRHRGEIVDVQGRVLGHHNGIEFFTVGQRRGLGISSSRPLYVVDLEAETNRVVVGDDSALCRDEFTIERCNWIPWEHPPASFEATVKIRYNHPGSPCVVEPREDGTARVRTGEMQRAVTPGQACVLYRDDLVLGGGWIRRGS